MTKFLPTNCIRYKLLKIFESEKELKIRGSLNAPAQGVTLYVEKINLASKLRELNQKWRWSRPFSGKISPRRVSHTDPSNIIISKFRHFKASGSQFLIKSEIQWNGRE